jgi:hypothetical protein
MGWCSGAEVMSNIIMVLMKEVGNVAQRIRIYEGIIGALENHDWDTQTDCLGEDPAFDVALEKLYPDWDWEGE